MTVPHVRLNGQYEFSLTAFLFASLYLNTGSGHLADYPRSLAVRLMHSVEIWQTAIWIYFDMDPITAVGFAASILTFIDFSWGIVTGTYEVYKSTTGTTSENAHINTIIEDLEKVTGDLISDIEGKTKHEKELCALADNCQKLSKNLTRILKRLQVSEKNSKWQSLKVKIASMRKEKEIASIEARLDKYRSQILVRLNFMLSEQQSSIKAQLDKIQNEGAKMSVDTAKQFTCLREELDWAVKALLESKTNREQFCSSEDIRSAILRLQTMSKSLTRETEILRLLYFDNMNAREDTVAEPERGTFKWIVEEETDSEGEEESDPDRSLSEEENQSMASTGSQRSSMLPDENSSGDEEDAATNSESELSVLQAVATHEEEPPRQIPAPAISLKRPLEDQEIQKCREMQVRTRDAFLTWLRSGNQIYHVSGKAGSGKSTLMKFLFHHYRVRRELESWASEKKLIFAQFFFWNSGEKLQMSLEGLYRSLLFETLKQCPELIPEIFPEEWVSLDSSTSRFEHPLRMPKIKAAFNRLVGKKKFSNYRLCFFIDGLDEYEGDSLEHWELTESLRRWASSTDIKICVSSRPHTEFMQTFSDGSNFRLRLHELTRQDVSRYSSLMFEKNPNFDRVKDIYTFLVRDVVREANGVFLWAGLVVRSLLEGVGRHDSEFALREKLESVPKDLNDLFSSLLSSINPSDRKRSDQMFLLATAETPLYPMNALWYSWLDNLNDPNNSNFPLETPCQGYSDEQIETRHRTLRSQLDGSSKGLLEMVSNERSAGDIYFGYTVQFFHRTVRDYLRDDSRQRQFRSSVPDFDLDAVYSRLCLAELKFARTRYFYFASPKNMLFEVFFKNHYWNQRSPYDESSEILRWDSNTASRSLSKHPQRHKNHHIPFDFTKETCEILSCYRRQPFSYPGETRENSGSIHWSGRFGITLYFLHNFEENLSVLHWAAWFGLTDYVSQRISSNPGLIKGDDEMSILLSASIGLNPRLVRYLLDAGANSEDLVSVTYRAGTRRYPLPEGTSTWMRTSVWMVFVYHFAQTALYLKRYPYFDVFLVLKEFIEFGVDTDIFFILRDQGPEQDSNRQWIGEWEDEDAAGKHRKLYSISFEDFVGLCQPESLEVLQALLNKTRRPIWGRTTSAIIQFLPWVERSTHIASKYQPFKFTELESGRFILHSYCSKTRELQAETGAFSFRIY